MFQRACNIFCPQGFFFFISYIHLKSDEWLFHLKSIMCISFLINDLNLLNSFLPFKQVILSISPADTAGLFKHLRKNLSVGRLCLCLKALSPENKMNLFFKFRYHQDADLGIKEKVSPIKGSHCEMLYCSL